MLSVARSRTQLYFSQRIAAIDNTITQCITPPATFLAILWQFNKGACAHFSFFVPRSTSRQVADKIAQCNKAFICHGSRKVPVSHEMVSGKASFLPVKAFQRRSDVVSPLARNACPVNWVPRHWTRFFYKNNFIRTRLKFAQKLRTSYEQSRLDFWFKCNWKFLLRNETFHVITCSVSLRVFLHPRSRVSREENQDCVAHVFKNKTKTFMTVSKCIIEETRTI